MTYQKKAFEHAKYTNTEYPFLALGEEAGEVLGKLAKYVRKNGVTVGQALLHARDPSTEVQGQLREDLIAELGDVQWQLAACATELFTTLELVQDRNLAKLAGREERGTIEGVGDDR